MAPPGRGEGCAALQRSHGGAKLPGCPQFSSFPMNISPLWRPRLPRCSRVLGLALGQVMGQVLVTSALASPPAATPAPC